MSEPSFGFQTANASTTFTLETGFVGSKITISGICYDGTCPSPITRNLRLIFDPDGAATQVYSWATNGFAYNNGNGGELTFDLASTTLAAGTYRLQLDQAFPVSTGGGVCPGYNYNDCPTELATSNFFVWADQSGASLFWTLPYPGDTLPDFTTWVLRAYGLDAYTDYNFRVNYSRVGSNTSTTDAATINTGGNNEILGVGVPKSTALFDPGGFSGLSNNFVATATISAAGSDLFSTSTTFTIQPFDWATTTIPQPTGTSTLTATCDPNSGFITNSLCSVFVYLFYPSQGSLDNFVNIKNTYQNKPPFGYFSKTISLLNGFSASESGDGVISTSTLAAFGSIFNPIKTGLSWILWLALLIWIIKRGVHLEL